MKFSRLWSLFSFFKFILVDQSLVRTSRYFGSMFPREVMTAQTNKQPKMMRAAVCYTLPPQAWRRGTKFDGKLSEAEPIWRKGTTGNVLFSQTFTARTYTCREAAKRPEDNRVEYDISTVVFPRNVWILLNNKKWPTYIIYSKKKPHTRSCQKTYKKCKRIFKYYRRYNTSSWGCHRFPGCVTDILISRDFWGFQIVSLLKRYRNIWGISLMKEETAHF